MNVTNRTLIVLLMAIVIVFMAVLIFMTWSAPDDIIDRLGDFVEYLARHNDDSGKLIVTLGALIVAVIALLVIIIELAPEDVERELKVQQAGATTIVPAEALRLRLEEAVMSMPNVSAAKAKVSTKDNAIAVAMDITVPQGTNVGHVTQDATRVALDTIERDLGLPAAGPPAVRVTFGEGTVEAGPQPEPPTEPEPVASSWSSDPATSEQASQDSPPPDPQPQPSAWSDPPSALPQDPPPTEPSGQPPSWSPPPLHPEAPDEDKRPENPY